MKRFKLLATGLAFAIVPCLAASAFPSGGVPTLGYVLQAEGLAGDRAGVVRKLCESDRDVLVLDEEFTANSPWTPAEIAEIRSGRKDRRIIAYLSIGEAENYRRYWQPDWVTHPPAWLGKENPDWPGNFRVNYWHPEWQGHILAALRRMVAVGFDGVYLDIVDAFEGFEHDPKTDQWRDHLKNPATGQSFRQDMSAWVRRIAETARAAKPGFAVIPQNGVQLLEAPQFAEAVDAVGVENLFSDQGRVVPEEDALHRLGFIQRLRTKPVFVIEYGLGEEALHEVRARCQALGFSLLVTDRELTRLGRAFAAKHAARESGAKLLNEKPLEGLTPQIP